ncbi:MAG: AAA family ATPase [Chlorobium sp.]|nr:AAA family ATPase [Chlorobium sp.]
MILDHIKICNFRQFYGDQTIYFSKSIDKNITVIHGENGFGKTALLNAFRWCLYGTINLPEGHILLNERTEGEATEHTLLTVSVELSFKDKGKSGTTNEYVVLRSLEGQKLDKKAHMQSESRLLVSINDETGCTTSPKNPQNTIDQILPETMCPYFFFDGESIDNLSKKEGSKDIQNAIKNIMGLEVLERAKTHLYDVRRNFMNELGTDASEEMKILIKKRGAIEEKMNDIQQKKETNNANIDALVKEKEDIENRLREQEGAKELQSERDRLKIRKGDIQKKIKTKITEIKEISSSRGYLAFSHKLIENVSSVIEDKRVRGEIPAGIKQQFVEDLLHNSKCICNTHLNDGTPEYEAVKSWLGRSGNKDLEDAFIQTSGNVKLLSRFRTELFADLKKLNKLLNSYSDELESVNQELDQVDTKLDGKDSEEIKNLERRRRDIENDEMKSLHFKQGEIANELNRLDVERQVLDKEIGKIDIVELKAQTAKKRMEACQSARDMIDKIYQAVATKVREDCQNKITEVYSRFLKKPYIAKLLDTYELQILKSFGDGYKTVAMSQGERQITSLSFIGALVDIARKNSKAQKTFYFGGQYPLIMDSPFGQLDPEHRKNVAEGIPELADQIILMVADQQWLGDIESTMSPKVGKEYYLKNHNPKNNKELKYEYSEIVEG